MKKYVREFLCALKLPKVIPLSSAVINNYRHLVNELFTTRTKPTDVPRLGYDCVVFFKAKGLSKKQTNFNAERLTRTDLEIYLHAVLYDYEC